MTGETSVREKDSSELLLEAIDPLESLKLGQGGLKRAFLVWDIFCNIVTSFKTSGLV